MCVATPPLHTHTHVGFDSTSPAGKRYIFRVYIALTPIYSKNKLGITSIDRWGRSVTSSRVDVVELSYFDRQVRTWLLAGRLGCVALSWWGWWVFVCEL